MAIDEAITDGISYLARALSEPGLGRLRRLQADAVYRADAFGEVARLQPAEIAKHSDLLHLDKELEIVVRDRGDLYQENDIAATGYSYDQAILHRYRAETSTEPVKESSRYQKLVCVFVLTGSLHVQAFDGDEVVKEWQCRGGDLVLLRGPGFPGMEQGRIKHSFTTDKTDASTLTLMMDTDDELETWVRESDALSFNAEPDASVEGDVDAFFPVIE